MTYIISFRKPCCCSNEGPRGIYKDTLLIIGLIFVTLGSICLYNWVDNDPYDIGIPTSRNLTLGLLIGGIFFIIFSLIDIRYVPNYYTVFGPQL